MTEYELFRALKPLYPAREYALLPQVANGTGARARRHCDALALSLWPSRGLHLTGFEMKSYRGDWIRELRNPEKADDVAKYCNYWYIVTTAGIVKEGELPPTWGLMVWDEAKKALKKEKASPYREAEVPDLPFLAGAIRKAAEVITPDAVIEEARREAYEQGQKQARATRDYELDNYKELQRKVKDFEKASGVQIARSWDTAKIGEAVFTVMNGTVERGRTQLIAVCEGLLRQLKPDGESKIGQEKRK